MLAKLDHQFSGRDQFSVRYSRYDVTATNSRGAGGLSAPTASSNLDNARPGGGDQQHADPVAAHRARNPRAVRARRSRWRRRPTRSAPRSASPAWRRSARARPARPAASTGCTRSSTTSRISAARTRCAPAIDFLYNDDLITFPALGARQLHVLVDGELPDRHLQQRRVRPDVRHHRAGADQSQSRHLSCRTNGRSRHA